MRYVKEGRQRRIAISGIPNQSQACQEAFVLQPPIHDSIDLQLSKWGRRQSHPALWGGEFGRTTTSENATGRGHNNRAFMMWMAGGGVKAGFQYGACDPVTGSAVSEKMHLHDLHATILHLLGLQHDKLTFRFGGRDYRLTDVGGVVAKDILA